MPETPGNDLLERRAWWRDLTKAAVPAFVTGSLALLPWGYSTLTSRDKQQVADAKATAAETRPVSASPERPPDVPPGPGGSSATRTDKGQAPPSAAGSATAKAATATAAVPPPSSAPPAATATPEAPPAPTTASAAAPPIATPTTPTTPPAVTPVVTPAVTPTATAPATPPPPPATASPLAAVVDGEFDRAVELAKADERYAKLRPALADFADAGQLMKSRDWIGARNKLRNAERTPELRKLAFFWRCKLARLEIEERPDDDRCLAEAGLARR